MVSILLISTSSSLSYQIFGNLLRAPIKICIATIFMFFGFFASLVLVSLFVLFYLHLSLFIFFGYYHFTYLRVFHTGVSWWFSTGVTASLLKSPGFFFVFRPILITLQFGWSTLISKSSWPSINLWWLCRAYNLQLVSQSLSCSIVFTFLLQSPGVYFSFLLLSALPCGHPERPNQRFGRYVLRPSSSVCRTREPSRNIELRPLLNIRGLY